MSIVAATVTKEERDAVASAAADLGLSVSAFLKHSILIAHYALKCAQVSDDTSDDGEWYVFIEAMWQAVEKMQAQSAAAEGVEAVKPVLEW